MTNRIQNITTTTRKAISLIRSLKSSGLKGTEISERLGYHWSWTSAVITNRQNVSRDQLVKLQEMTVNDDNGNKVLPSVKTTADLVLSLFSSQSKQTMTGIIRRLSSKEDIAIGNIQRSVYRLRKEGKLIYVQKYYYLPEQEKEKEKNVVNNHQVKIEHQIDHATMVETLSGEINKLLKTEEMKEIIYEAFSKAVEHQFEVEKKEKNDN